MLMRNNVNNDVSNRRIMKMKSNTSLKSAVKIINNVRPLFLTENVLLSF